jgi:hypothetical protein
VELKRSGRKWRNFRYTSIWNCSDEKEDIDQPAYDTKEEINAYKIAVGRHEERSYCRKNSI